MSPKELVDLVLRAARELRVDGLPGVVVSCLPVLAMLSLVLVPLAWQKGGRVLTPPLLAYVSTLGAGLLCAGLLIRRLRIGFVRAALHQDAAADASTKARWLSSYLANEFNAELMIGLALVIAVPVLGAIVGARWAKRAGPSLARAALPLAATAALAAPLCLLGVCLVLHVLGMRWTGCGMSQALRYEAMIGSYDVLARATLVVWGCAAVGTMALVAAGLACRIERAGAWALSGAAILTVGVAAWLGTRNHAYDAEHPLPFVEETWPDESLDRAPVATAQMCAPAKDGPLVVADERGLVLDGVPEPGPYELEERLRKKRELWMTLNPRRTFPGLVLMTAPAETPIDRLALAVAAARRAGYPHAVMLLSRPVEPAVTRTLGVVGRSRIACQVPLPEATAWSGLATWGELAKRALEP